MTTPSPRSSTWQELCAADPLTTQIVATLCQSVATHYAYTQMNRLDRSMWTLVVEETWRIRKKHPMVLRLKRALLASGLTNS